MYISDIMYTYLQTESLFWIFSCIFSSHHIVLIWLPNTGNSIEQEGYDGPVMLSWVSWHLENLTHKMIKENILTKIHDDYINK